MHWIQIFACRYLMHPLGAAGFDWLIDWLYIFISSGGFGSASIFCRSTSHRCREGELRASLIASNLLLLLAFPLLHLLMRFQKTLLPLLSLLLRLQKALHPRRQLLHTRLQPALTQISCLASWRPSGPSGRVRCTQPPPLVHTSTEVCRDSRQLSDVQQRPE